ncbi:CPBP family intramembrane glutamic endopeptidase [Pseudonocardia lacus]|uniref:CPBP family intramembrane glutamic endopeptidase n=1 Tax=Pseudonocardia lacus TaxID=2835865 RepID=UPI0027E2BC54|nr:CPBP family glutamic-type intramembrane protease [Pseudonocardia lacus]
MGPGENDERPGETGPDDGFRAAGGPPPGAEPAEHASPADPPPAVGAPDAVASPAEEPVGVTNGTSAHGAARNGGGSAAALWSAPDWDPTAPDPHPAASPVPVGTAAVGPAAPTAPAAPAAPGASPSGWEGPPSAPPRRTHRWGLGAYIVVEVIFLGTSLLISWLLATDGPPAASSLAIALAAPTVLTAATALLITRLRGNGPIADLGLTPTWRDVGLGVAFGVGGLVVTIPASVLFVAIVGEDATSAVGAVFGDVSASVPWAIAVFLIVVFVAPLCEEIVYRGLLWGGVERLAGPKVAFGVSTLLFALAHFEFTRTPLLLVVALPIAIARYYTGRLTASVVAHQINNLLPGVVLLLGLLGIAPLG